MSPLRSHDLTVFVASSLLLVLMTAPRADGACNATCERDRARCMAAQCEGVPRAACRRHCKPAAIRTLAYALTECRRDAAGNGVNYQALRIRRGDREPITVMEFGGFGASDVGPDPQGLCRVYGRDRLGGVVVVAGPLQRLGVSPNGSGVVFEVNSPPQGLPADQHGFFFVRADGSRPPRLLGPASRDPCFRVGEDPTGTYPFVENWAPTIPFSPNGRRIAFTDLGPGPGGEDAVQIVTLDLATDTPTRRQVTHLPSGSPPGAGPSIPSFLTAYPRFIDNDTIGFLTFTDPDGSNPEHKLAFFTVRIDGRGLRQVIVPTPVAGVGSRIIPVFGVATLAKNVFTLNVDGTPANASPGFTRISEVFVQDGKNLLQLTNFQRADTQNPFPRVTGTQAFFAASGDPLKKNPSGTCQLFSINTDGSGLRQLTHFVSGDPGACGFSFPSSCLVGLQFGIQDPVTKAVVFDSTCDPFHANPYGGQLFAMRSDGSGLRQLTDAAGFTENPDGSFRVELPGPFAYSARPD